MDAEQIKTLLDMRMAKYPDHACLMQELTFKDEKIAALEADNVRDATIRMLEAQNAELTKALAGRRAYSCEPALPISADPLLLAQNAKLRKALSECVEALAGIRGIVLEVETACDIWHGRGLVGSRPGMFRISYAVANPKSSVAIVKAGVVEKRVREVLGDDPITPGR